MMNTKTFILLILATAFIACGAKNSTLADEQKIDPEKIYKLNCVLCHGINGKLGMNGSKDITISPLSLKERITLIKHGKNTMTPFKDVLSDAEIKAVAKYTLTLK